MKDFHAFWTRSDKSQGNQLMNRASVFTMPEDNRKMSAFAETPWLEDTTFHGALIGVMFRAYACECSVYAANAPLIACLVPTFIARYVFPDFFFHIDSFQKRRQITSLPPLVSYSASSVFSSLAGASFFFWIFSRTHFTNVVVDTQHNNRHEAGHDYRSCHKVRHWQFPHFKVAGQQALCLPLFFFQIS